MIDTAKLKEEYPLQEIVQQKTDIETTMATAHNSAKQLDMGKLANDLAYYSSLATKIQELHVQIADYEGSQEMLEADPEMAEMARDEVSKLEKSIPTLAEEITAIQIERKFSDPDDDKSVILEIRAGAGGDEASLFASELFTMYSNFATSKDWKVGIIESSTNEQGGYKEVVAKIEGKKAYKYLKYESGVHRVQRIPVTESGGRIHTSTASVAILPEATNVDINIKESDLKVETMKASGAGGQHVNKTSSAIRMTYLPTGETVYCQESRVQQQNRARALEILRARIYEKKRAEEAAKRDNLRSGQIGTAMRAEKIRTYNFPQSRITDHRIKQSWHNLDEILSGGIEDLLKTVSNEMLKLMLKNSK